LYFFTRFYLKAAGLAAGNANLAGTSGGHAAHLAHAGAALHTLVLAGLASGHDLHASQTHQASWGHQVAHHLAWATAGQHDLHASQTQHRTWADLAAHTLVAAGLAGSHDLHASQTHQASWGHDVAGHLAWATTGQHDLHAGQTNWAELGTGTALAALVGAGLADLLDGQTGNLDGGNQGDKLAGQLTLQLVLHSTAVGGVGLEGTSLPLGKDVTLDIHLTSVAGKGHFVIFHKILFRT
jgi:hypothetical protein